jgi:flagellar motor switch protein FliM
MRLIGKSIHNLRAERDALQAEIDAQALHLTGRNVSTDQLIRVLTPLTTKLGAIKRQIILRTPHSELATRKQELERQTASISTRPTPYELSLLNELSELKLHLDYPLHNRPLTLKAFLILAAIVAAAIFLPDIVVRMLAP